MGRQTSFDLSCLIPRQTRQNGTGRHSGNWASYSGNTERLVTGCQGHGKRQASGQNGSSNYVEILRDSKQTREREIYSKPARVPLKKGDVVRMVTATGGGWGDPMQRPQDKVLDDIKNGYITAEQAARYRGGTH